MTEPLVSVVVPVFQVEQYLPRCIESLIAQTYKRIEIILVDDGSTDESGAICDDYARRDRRVRVLHQDNAGTSAARNAGIEMAQGAALTFVDPDDWVHVELVARLVAILEDADADLAVCRFLRTEGEVVPVGHGGPVRVMDVNQGLAMYGGPSASWMTSPCAKLYRAVLFDEIRFPVGRRFEDEFTTYRVVARARRIAVSDECLYYYFKRPGSATQGELGIGQLLDRVDALREQASFFGERGLASVGGNALWRAFLVQRQVRGRVVGTGDEAMITGLTRDTRAVAASLWTSGEAASRRVFASLYVRFPATVDRAVHLYQIWTGRRPDGEKATR